MARRSGRSLTFKDAVRLLDDGSPFVRDLDELIEHAFDALPGGKLLGLPYFAFRRKLVEYGSTLVRGLRDRLDGVGRYDRTRRLHAAHTVIVMTSFAEAMGELLDGADLQIERSVGMSELSEEHGHLILRYDYVVTPDPVSTRWTSRSDTLLSLYSDLTSRALMLLSSWGLRDTELRIDLPGRALRRYEENYRSLVAQVPEFGVWAYLTQHEATRADLRNLGDELFTRLAPLTTGLAAVSELLAEVSGSAAANRVRVELARTYQAVLGRSVLGETHAPDGVVLPTLEHGYVNPAARAAAIASGDRPSEDHWWDEQTRYADIQSLLVGELTAPDAVHGPLVILGQPGAGKSVLTRILSARLANRGFLPVRVELRNVPADADIQAQVEHGIHDMTGRTIEWPELAQPASDDGLLPLVILDGFDELLQATGVNRTDYLEQVARFQQREFNLGRPVAVIVTSRTAVADRARFPESTVVLRIEPFDEDRVTTWLGVWNATNGTSLDTATMLRFGELAEQPLLLTLLAMYDAGTGALSSTEAELSRAELYDRLLSEFARREVRKSDKGMDRKQEDREVAKELLRLEIIALAMFNRHAKAITGEDLDRDLAALLPDDHSRERGGSSLQKPLTVAQLMVGRFFFVHQSSVQRAGDTEHAYEFLHATFGEFLVARYVVEILRSLARLRAFQEGEGAVSGLDDGKLWAALSFAALTGSKASVEFTEGLLCRLPDGERTAVRELTVELLRDAAYANPGRSLADYEPDRRPAYERHACYSANLTVLAVLSTGGSLEFYPIDMGVWYYALWYAEFTGLRDTLRVLSNLGVDGYDLRIAREDGSAVDPYKSDLRFRVIDHDLNPADRLFIDTAVPAESSVGHLLREKAFRLFQDMSLAALQAYFEFISDGFGAVPDGGIAIPVARGLLELRLSSVASRGAARRCALYRWCFDHQESGCERRWLEVVFRQLREDVRELDFSDVASLLQYALDRNALNMASEGLLDVLHALRDVHEVEFYELIDTDDRVRQLVTDDPQK